MSTGGQKNRCMPDTQPGAQKMQIWHKVLAGTECEAQAGEAQAEAHTPACTELPFPDTFSHIYFLPSPSGASTSPGLPPMLSILGELEVTEKRTLGDRKRRGLGQLVHRALDF